jgi:hypothetical protein
MVCITAWSIEATPDDLIIMASFKEPSLAMAIPVVTWPRDVLRDNFGVQFLHIFLSKI